MADEIVKELPDTHDWNVCSFNKKCIERLIKTDHKFKVGYIHNGFLGLPNCEGIDFISLYYENITPKKVKHYHSLGILVYAWTVPHDKFQKMIDMGVDEIIIDI